ncbi:hypothetical protein BDP27DRAFT_992053 [Rhodocollybia butyracea]|uniref:Uncharacterized protein n=1 Tax=Rhodocollybia butyracea TaxID=206335 RepID=A0A9P5U4E4_9AGAR|nr:hypothetical protein BDP27DRAFT_992053 [Rhodocollybia butyracea]
MLSIVKHNIKRVAGSPAGRAAIAFKDLSADTTELALISAAQQYQLTSSSSIGLSASPGLTGLTPNMIRTLQIPQRTLSVLWNVRSGQKDYYYLANGEMVASTHALYQTLHIAMVNFLRGRRDTLIPTTLPSLTPVSPNYLKGCLAQFEGEHDWVGYYTYGERCDEPMSLTLSLSPVRSKPDHTHELSGKGVDGIGPFTIQGIVNERSEGTFYFLKQYQSFGWDYTGMVLPYGLVGHYSSGAFWLWIRD